MASPLLLRNAAATCLVSIVIYFLFTHCIIIIFGVFHAVMPSVALVSQPFAPYALPFCKKSCSFWCNTFRTCSHWAGLLQKNLRKIHNVVRILLPFNAKDRISHFCSRIEFAAIQKSHTEICTRFLHVNWVCGFEIPIHLHNTVVCCRFWLWIPPFVNTALGALVKVPIHNGLKLMTIGTMTNVCWVKFNNEWSF